MQLKLTAFTLGSGKLFFYGKRPLKNRAWFLCCNTVKPEYSDTNCLYHRGIHIIELGVVSILVSLPQKELSKSKCLNCKGQ